MIFVWHILQVYMWYMTCVLCNIYFLCKHWPNQGGVRILTLGIQLPSIGCYKGTWNMAPFTQSYIHDQFFLWYVFNLLPFLISFLERSTCIFSSFSSSSLSFSFSSPFSSPFSSSFSSSFSFLFSSFSSSSALAWLEKPWPCRLE